MTHVTDPTDRILTFAHLLDDGAAHDRAERAARERGWIDPSGRPTRDGADLARALGDQARTRTALRNV